MHARLQHQTRTHSPIPNTYTVIYALTQNEMCAAVKCCSSNADFRMRACKIFAHCSISCLIRLMRVYVIRNLLCTHTHTCAYTHSRRLSSRLNAYKYENEPTHVCSSAVQCSMLFGILPIVN